MFHGSKCCAVNKQHIKKECNIKENVEMDEWQHINRYKRNEYFSKELVVSDENKMRELIEMVYTCITEANKHPIRKID